MKEALRAAGGLLIAAVVVVVITAMALNGCGEEREADNTGGMLGDLKVPEAVPAAPQAPNVGTPFVKEVSYYADWKLTKKVTDTVEPGTTLFIKVVFSEPMKLVVSDGNDARPILYRRRSGEGEALVRFRMAAHGSGGADFVSGDAKPWQNGTDDYICKYTVVPEDAGKQIAFMVGKFSVDTDGNPLAAFYTNKEKLSVEEPKPEQPAVTEISYYADSNFTEPIEVSTTYAVYTAVHPGDTIYTKVVFSGALTKPDISYRVGTRTSQYFIRQHNVPNKDLRSGDAKVYRDTENVVICKYVVQRRDIGWIFESYADDANIFGGALEVVEVPPRHEPIISMSGLNLDFFMHGDGITDKPKTEYKGIVPDQRDFAGYVLVPKVRRGECGPERPISQPVSDVTVTITAGPRSGESTVTDRNGQYLFKNVQEDELHLRVEKEHFETKEVIAHRFRATTLADGTVPNYGGDIKTVYGLPVEPQKIPGNILIGQAWPDAVRPLLQQVQVVSDLLFIIADVSCKDQAGNYREGMVLIPKRTYDDYSDAFVVHVIAHEIAHAYQDALVFPDGNVGDGREWENTPEGIAFAAAWQKDLREVGQAEIDHIPHFSFIHENAAEVCAYYWTGVNVFGNLSVTAPNRFKWAEEWLNK